MQTNFWHDRWQRNDITGFHEKDTNPALIKYFKELSLKAGSRVFLPLCGKTRDIAWLISNGYRVAGAELIELATEQLFGDLEVKPKILEFGQIKHYSAKNIEDSRCHLRPRRFSGLAQRSTPSIHHPLNGHNQSRAAASS